MHQQSSILPVYPNRLNEKTESYSAKEVKDKDGATVVLESRMLGPRWDRHLLIQTTDSWVRVYMTS
jgi:hypothetical protein